jgi:hypothetical protein
MTAPHNLNTERGSDTTLDTATIDAEKQNRISDTASSLEDHPNDVTVTNGDVEKGVAKPNAEAGPAAAAPPNFMDMALCSRRLLCLVRLIWYDFTSSVLNDIKTDRMKAGSTVLVFSRTTIKLTSCQTTHQALLHGSHHWKLVLCS